jgi:hypothetical protein
LLAAFVVPSFAGADDPVYTRAQGKIDFLMSGQASPGSAVSLSADELNAWARVRVPVRYPGVRAPKIMLGAGNATASAMIDFAQVLQGQGHPLNPAAAIMARGEHPVLIAVRIESSGGKAVVTPTRVEVAGAAATGAVLDALVKTFFLPLFPEAKIGQPFEMGLGVDRLEVRPDGVRFTIKRTPMKTTEKK